MAVTDVQRLKALWNAYRNRLPDGARVLVVHNWLPTDREQEIFSYYNDADDTVMELPETVRFELRRVVHQEDRTVGAVQVLANGIKVAVEGFHTVRA